MQLLEAEEDTRVTPDADPVVFRRPSLEDGKAVQDLVASCATLDDNSLYCNFLQCTHFADTSVVAEHDGTVLGWISGYCPPAEPATLFIWQVAVHGDARGSGLARKMLFSLLERDSLGHIRHLKTTITPGNDASRALFRSLAGTVGAPIVEAPGFEEERHFSGRHASECLVTIGPLRPRQNARSAA